MKTIKLSKCEVDIVDGFTWGQAQELESVLVNGAKIGASGFDGYNASVILEAKYKALEMAVKEIREEDKKIGFSREWMNALSIEDGNLLYNAVDALVPKKK